MSQSSCLHWVIGPVSQSSCLHWWLDPWVGVHQPLHLAKNLLAADDYGCRQFIVVVVQDYQLIEFLGHCFGSTWTRCVLCSQKGIIGCDVFNSSRFTNGSWCSQWHIWCFQVGACCNSAVYLVTSLCWGVHDSFFIDLDFLLLFTMSCRESVKKCIS